MGIKKKTTRSFVRRFVMRRKSRLGKEKKPKKSVRTTALVKSGENPIISPKGGNGWDAWQTFNPGVVLLENKVHFLYRAIGEDGMSRFGYAVSDDGFYINERLSSPVYEHKVEQDSFAVFSYFSGGSWGGAEDPRLVRIDKEDVVHMIYTACDNGLRMALTSIKVDDFLGKKWKWKSPQLISPPGETHKNWVIFPEKINGKYAILHSITPEVQIAYLDSLDFSPGQYIQSFHNNVPRKNCWDAWVRGTGAPPIKTKHGWLLFYHAMEADDFSKYKVGVVLLDLDDPTKVLHRSQKPVLEPEESYENQGFKPGVTYVTGAVIKDGLLLVYYGSADSYVSVAYAPFEGFVEALVKGARSKLKLKLVRRK